MRLVLAYPNRYWVAMSNLGFQTVHRLFSSISRRSAGGTVAFLPRPCPARSSLRNRIPVPEQSFSLTLEAPLDERFAVGEECDWMIPASGIVLHRHDRPSRGEHENPVHLSLIHI